MLQNLFVDSSRQKPWRWASLSVTLCVVAMAGTGYSFWRLRSTTAEETPTAVVKPSQIRTVTALGRLEPQGEVIKLSAPTGSSGDRIEQLLVQAGDRVTAGQVIAILDSRDRLQAAYEQAQEAVRVAQARLALTQAGAKQGEITAQRAEIARLEAQRQGDIDAQTATVARFSAELQNAESELNRYQALAQQGAISASTLDSKRLAFATARRSLQEAKAVLARIQSTSPAQLSQARATLQRITEVRPVEVAVDQAEVERAIAAVKQASADLNQAYVRSPIAGEILEIHTRAGEAITSNGIAEIGNTQQMYAIAQVYQSDIQRVKPGQQVRVSSDAIAGDLWGKVKRIDSQVKRQTLVNTDPSTNVDGRVVEVHVALDAVSSRRAAKFTNLQVTVEIEHERPYPTNSAPDTVRLASTET
jgi:HlyD family secretion protein